MTSTLSGPRDITFMQGVHTVIQKPLECANAVKKDGNAFYSALKFASYAYMGADHLWENQKPITQMMQKVGYGLAVIDVFDLPASLHYWVSGEWRNDALTQVLANASFCLATIGGFFLWLVELGWSSAKDFLAAVAAGIGNIPIVGKAFEFVAQVGLGNAVSFLATVGYGFLAADAIKNIINADNGEKVVKGFLDSFSSIAYVALNILLMVTGICVPIIVVLGLTASGFGMTSFLYTHFNEKALN